MPFNTPSGHYEYLVKRFRLTVFQCFVKDVLQDLLNRNVFMYIYDILIFSKSLEEHISHVQAILQCLLQHSLYVKAEKFQFNLKSVSFLDFIIGKGNIQMDPEKVSDVAMTPGNSYVFLGLQTFTVASFGTTALYLLLTALMSSQVPFQWSC